MSTQDLSRRGFMAAAAGSSIAVAAGTAVAQDGTDNESAGGGNESGGTGNESGGTGNESGSTGNESGGGGGGQVVPDFGSYLSDANGFEEGGTTDARGDDQVTVEVGTGSDGYGFGPATVWVSAGTTITWEWTGEGGNHNVVPNEGPAGFEHQDTVGESGYTYEYEVTEEDAGITTYYCNPHEGQGMKGGVAVGDDVETVEISAPSGPDIEIPNQAMALTTATLIAMGSTLGLGYFLMKFGGDYEE